MTRVYQKKYGGYVLDNKDINRLDVIVGSFENEVEAKMFCKKMNDELEWLHNNIPF